MTKKKKEIPMPEIKQSRVVKKYYIIAGVGLLVLLGTALWARSQSTTEYVQKNVVNNYVCKIVGADAESDMIAVECLTK